MDENSLSTRPWGSYEILDEDSGYKVKRIEVLPGQRLSLQRHTYRAEHWYIIKGEGVATLDDKEFHVQAGDTITVEKRMIHRIHNRGQDILIFIEVQTGSYFGEDDIERLQDDYQRI